MIVFPASFTTNRLVLCPIAGGCRGHGRVRGERRARPDAAMSTG